MKVGPGSRASARFPVSGNRVAIIVGLVSEIGGIRASLNVINIRLRLVIKLR